MAGRDSIHTQTGKLVHGTSVFKEAEGYKPVASIPAKFETVLFTGPREKKGFGSVSRRFGEQEKDNPGPGSYVQTTDTLEYKHDSISRKGFGSMVSKDKRWKKNRALYSGPGPGEYSQRAADEERTFNRAATTSAFHPPVKPIKALDPDDGATPGPGSYSAEDTTRNGQRLEWDANSHTHRSAFKATPHKLHLLGNVESPAATRYTLTDPWDPVNGSNKASSRTPSKAGMSSFAGRSAGGLSSLGPMNPALFLEDPKAPKKLDTGPGPGSYELQYFESIRTTLDKGQGRPSANFQQPEYVDRFGRSRVCAPASDDYATTGPVSATPPGQTRINSPGPGVSAPFKSTAPSRSEYDLTQAGKAPGPAFYSPQTLPKRTSHHLNARKRMVA